MSLQLNYWSQCVKKKTMITKIKWSFFFLSFNGVIGIPCCGSMKVLVNILMMEESNKRGHGKERRMMGIHHVYIYVLSFLLATPFLILHTFSFIHSGCLWGNLRIGNVRWLRTRWASVPFYSTYTLVNK